MARDSERERESESATPGASPDERRPGRSPLGALAGRLAVAWLAVAALAATAGVARAHAVTSREFTAPVPFPAVLAGAGATVAATAGWLAVADRRADADTVADRRADADTVSDRRSGSEGAATDRSGRRVVRLPARVARPLALAARVGFLALFLGALAHGLAGRQAPAENLATLFVWPLLLKGVGILAVVAGSPWRVLSPWRTLYEGVVAVEGRPVALLGDYPGSLGAWPAVVGFVVGVGIVENLTVATRSPRFTVALAAGYTAVMLAGAAAYGREWFDRADALAVLFDLLGRVAAVDVRRSDEGGATVVVRPPWRGATAPLADAATVVFVVATVYTVSFDGFTATRLYQRVLFDARSVAGTGVASVALYLAGLVAFVASFLAAVALFERLGSRAGGGREPGAAAHSRGPVAAARAFGGTVVPIAAAYEVAHNYPFVAANLGGALTVVRDLALGTAGDPISLLAWLPTVAFWGSQVLLIVGGHVVAVVAAHRVAVARYPTVAAARRGHAPLVVVMVGYTLLSLWIVSRPIV